jgi:hypothetical protein
MEGEHRVEVAALARKADALAARRAGLVSQLDAMRESARRGPPAVTTGDRSAAAVAIMLTPDGSVAGDAHNDGHAGGALARALPAPPRDAAPAVPARGRSLGPAVSSRVVLKGGGGGGGGWEGRGGGWSGVAHVLV